MPIKSETPAGLFALLNRSLKSGDKPYEFKPSLANDPPCAVDHAPEIAIDPSFPSAIFGRDQLPVLQGTCGRRESFLLS